MVVKSNGYLLSVYQDKTALAGSTTIINNAGPSASQQSIQPQRTNKKRVPHEANIHLRKQTNCLQVNDIKGFTLNQKEHVLVDTFGSKNILNLASPGLIPERFQSEILQLMKRYEFTLSLTANEKERQLLI
ncbi:hypothetical protein EDC94DRAFT_660886 [Helicostylum pulchrum]|nr:hypothetical protein EDC94DRAFT_660886 [Helicostylum pulchrum]